jgi:carbamoyltransferase
VAVVLGVNAVFHDPAAALVVDGVTVAAAEEERFSRRKHGKTPVPFSTWELPERSIDFCLDFAGLGAADIDAVGYSYDPHLAPCSNGDVVASAWEGLRTLYAERAELFLRSVLPALRPGVLHHVPHHVAHAASAWGMAPFDSCAVMVLDGRGERSSYLAGVARDGVFRPLATQELPDSLGLRYEELTGHLGFRPSSDEYKVMALASYGEPSHLPAFRTWIRTEPDGHFSTAQVPWNSLLPRRVPGDEVTEDGVDRDAANLASSLQVRLQEVMLELAEWLHACTGEGHLALAGGVALNCVANTYLYEHSPFESVWVQPAAGDAGTAAGAAIQVAASLGDAPSPMRTAALGPEWSDEAIEAALRAARIKYDRSPSVACDVAEALAADDIVAWFQGRSEFGPRALGHRSLLAHPGHAANLDRLNSVKGREQFRPVAPMVAAERAAEIFEGGPLPSPYMLFVHHVRPAWRDRIPAVVHVDNTARVQTVCRDDEPLVHDLLTEFDRRSGLPVVVNTSLNTASRPMVNDPRDALECFGSAPIDLLAIGSFVVRRDAWLG